MALLRSRVGVVYNGIGRSSSGIPDQHQAGIMVVNKWTSREVASHLCIGDRFAIGEHVQPQPQQLWRRGGSSRRCSRGRGGCWPADHERRIAVFGCWGSIQRCLLLPGRHRCCPPWAAPHAMLQSRLLPGRPSLAALLRWAEAVRAAAGEEAAAADDKGAGWRGAFAWPVVVVLLPRFLRFPKVWSRQGQP